MFWNVWVESRFNDRKNPSKTPMLSATRGAPIDSPDLLALVRQWSPSLIVSSAALEPMVGK